MRALTRLEQTVLALVAELREYQDACGNWEAVARVHQDEAIRARQMDAELRAARHLIGTVHARLVGCYDPQLEDALAAYDKVTREVAE